MLTGYAVEINQRCVNSRRDEGEWASWSSEYDNEFLSICRVNEYPDIVSSLSIPSGTRCYVVWAEWSTGDSFGRARCSEVDGMGVFLDGDAASEFAEALEKEGKCYETLKFTTSDDQDHVVNRGWDGFFETLEAIHVEYIIMR